MSSDVELVATARGSLTVFPIESVRAFGVDAFFTSRAGGVSTAPYDTLNLGDHVEDVASDVAENRRRVAAAIGVDVSRLAIVRQVHGDTVLDASTATPTSSADALITDRDDVALAILVADCLPILLVDTASSRIAVVHAGWRGLVAGVIRRALAAFANAATVHAFIGPSISSVSYQVGPEVARHFANVPTSVSPDVEDRFRLDLRLVATRQLLDGGVSANSIEQSEQVTDGGSIFFSDRARRPCGRFALVAKRAT